jgi:hypothetical protein
MKRLESNVMAKKRQFRHPIDMWQVSPGDKEA